MYSAAYNEGPRYEDISRKSDEPVLADFGDLPYVLKTPMKARFAAPSRSTSPSDPER